jgi:biotin carboxylase
VSDIRVAIVDPYSSGAMLAEALQERNVQCIAVQSSPLLPDSMKSGFNPDGFVEVIDHRDDLDETLSALERHQPSHVIAGFESGVELADMLSERLGVPSNGTKLSKARRNKYLMLETMRAHGFRTPVQLRSSQVDEIIDWIDSTVEWPVIIKPVKSVASDNVYCCTCNDDVRHATEAILSGVNILGLKNSAVLVQEFLEGTEYVVDCVSYDGHRKTTALWQYTHPVDQGIAITYDTMTLIPYEGARQKILQKYVYKILDALAIQYGPSHCELMWTKDGPVLIEIGARLTTGINSVLSKICGGICQLDETINMILEPEKFLESEHEQPVLKKRAANVFLIPPIKGRLVGIHGLDKIESLPTLYSMSIGTKPETTMKRVAGLVTLVDEEIQAIENDTQTIHNLVRNGLFEIEGMADHKT